jgi:hypothetical protein
LGSSAFGAKGKKALDGESDTTPLLTPEQRANPSDKWEEPDPKQGLWDKIKMKLESLVECEKTLPDAVLQATGFDLLYKKIQYSQLAAKIPEVFKRIMEGAAWCTAKALTGFFCKIPDTIRTAGKLVKTAGHWTLKVVDYVGTKLSGMVRAAKNKLDGWQELKDDKKESGSLIAQAKGFFMAGYKRVTGCWNNLKQLALAKAANPAQSFKDLASWVCKNAGSKLADVAMAAITGGASAAEQALGSLVSDMPKSLLESVGKKSLEAAGKCMAGK